MEQNEFQKKADVVRFLLETEGRVMLCVDATQKGVDVPRRFANDSGLMLVLNGSMPQPIHILDDAIASELRFGGIPHYCIIPYTALWSAFNPDTNHGMTWPKSIPDSMRHTHQALQMQIEQPAMEEASSQSTQASPSKKSTSPFLKVVDGTQEPATTQATPPSKRKPTLRLVE